MKRDAKKQTASHQQPCAHEIGLLHSVISFAVLAETDKDGVDAKLERKQSDQLRIMEVS